MRIRIRIRNTGTFTSFFKVKKSHRSYIKLYKSRFFLPFLLDDGMIRAGSVLVTNSSGSGRPKPDPQHCLLLVIIFICLQMTKWGYTAASVTPGSGVR